MIPSKRHCFYNLWSLYMYSSFSLRTITKTDMAWGLSLGFCSKGTARWISQEWEQLLSWWSNLKYSTNILFLKSLVQLFRVEEMTYFKKNLRPNCPEFFFITFHDFTTRASCSSVKPPPKVFMFSGMLIKC